MSEDKNLYHDYLVGNWYAQDLFIYLNEKRMNHFCFSLVNKRERTISTTYNKNLHLIMLSVETYSSYV